MATYAIGDIQGCFHELMQLLERIGYDPAADTLWFTGDLVNRGPRSLEVLRFVKGLGERAVTVLGNHDLHLLAVSEGKHRHFTASDTLGEVLEAPDRDELMAWLRRQPLLHHDAALGWTLVHAGLPPQWDLATAQACAAEVETVLRGPAYRDFIEHMYGNQPDRWSGELRGWERLRFTVNCLTRLRYCSKDGALALAPKGTPGGQAPTLVPWFDAPGRRSAGSRLVFGHWSTLGLHRGKDVLCLDTGCLWGGALTAVRLDDPELSFTSLPCAGARTPGEE
jgi:bis(5'-nucleosyl)-tetraphosphatase (symmetrical)